MIAAVTARPKARVFPGRRDQVQHARDFVGRMLAGCPAADDAVLLASELATNAVVHTASGAGGRFAVIVHREPGGVRVEVWDGGAPTPPVVRPSEGAECGRGLGLVEMLAQGWGHHGGPLGRVVWFEVSLHAQDSGSRPRWLARA